ncbi:Serine/threonine-protein kinase PknA [Minicystis rosea]|nr:Serine/threonine-protein kinase PknA [Minicystis rosea]
MDASGQGLVVKRPILDPPSLRSVGRLVHEHRILTKLADVPGVVRARALTQDVGSAALWLEDSGLRSLDRVLAERGRLPLEAALRVVRALCRALEGVHAAGVVHKDVTPQNILVDEACSTALLIDFGLASELAQEATEASIPEALEGTLAYISPEQTGRTARGLDSRTDLYSLGVTLFEMLTGRSPFPGSDALAVVYAHLAKAPPALEGLLPGVPSVVARMVERCLEKPPEQRYQTAHGLFVDLDRCLSTLEERGQMDPFPLGQKDFSPKLQLPQTLVSREEESHAITAAFERATKGAVEVLLLGGPSGVGKSALVRSVYREIAEAGRGLLLSGKHDQLGRSVPYAAIGQAFRGLMSSVAGSPKPVFDAWRARLDRALGPLARVIADVVPELAWLMGALPPVPVVPTEMSYNRIKHSWIEFVRAVTDASPPLVLFLDDLQWVDPASLDLLKTLLTDVSQKHLLVIAAFRDNEVDAGHPLWNLIDAVEKSGVRTPRLTVGPLDEASVQTWLAVALATEPVRVRPLAAALFQKTQGNPFFLGQLLLELHRQKRVHRDLTDGVWHWDQAAVERAAVTDNVVELMRSKVVELPERTQELLGQAACAGHSFSLEELSVLTGLGAPQVTTTLWPALVMGLVIPVDGHYREARALAQAEQAEQAELDARYRFLHDRVQQACYERIAPERRARTHLQIGRRLQEEFDHQGGSIQKQLELVRHLNLGSGELTGETEKRALARLNLPAAKAAKTNGSYRLQAMLVEQAQDLLGARAWEEEPQLSIELALEQIEADYMLREFDEVHRRAEELLARPLSALPRLGAQVLRVRTYVASGQFGEGERLGLLALEEQGIRYPASNDACIVEALRLIAACDAWFDQHPDGFATMPADPSLEHLQEDSLEVAMVLCAAFGSRPALAALAMARKVHEVIERGGLTPASPFFIAAIANGRAAFLEKYRGDVRWPREGARVALRLASPFFPECSFMQGMYAAFEVPIEEAREHYRTALRAGTISGSFQGASWGMVGELLYLDLWRGSPVEQLVQKEGEYRDLLNRAGDMTGQRFFTLAASYSAVLRAPERPRAAPGKVWLTASADSFLAAGDGFVAECARVLEAHVSLVLGDHARAFALAEEAECYRPILYGISLVTDIPLWRGLSAAKLCTPSSVPAERASLSAILDHAIERFRYLTEGCAGNFGHKLRLLEAERARIHGRIDEAMARYDEAITWAREERFLHIEALAAQLCAELHLDAGRERIGALYLHEARAAYARWGARALVAHLDARYPTSTRATVPTSTGERAVPGLPVDEKGAQLDVGTVIRAAEALSSELDPAQVVGRLMELVLENAGAQRGALVLKDGEALSVVARLSADGTRVETGLVEPLGQSHAVASTAVQYVACSGEPLVVNDVRSDRRLGDDPYLDEHAVRSLLALPLTHRGRLVGVLCLEHRDAPSAFPPTRVALLSVLASQAAIAVENARLYSNVEAQVRALQARNQEILQLNEELRRQIERRSRRLLDTLLSPDTASPPDTTLPIGEVLGDCYRVVRLIGEGGMGVVYEVERTTDGRRLATKILRSRPDRDALGRFAREAQILARLSHPNLISIFDMDVTSDGRLYLVMELVNGSSLWHLRARFGEVQWGLRVLRQVAEALSVLHAQSVVHRDLKPENILLESAASDALPVVKLVDFGISVILDETRGRLREVVSPTREMRRAASAGGADAWDRPDTSDRRRAHLVTQTGVIIGTPLYMAPELLHGSKNAQPTSDVFSLGIIAFELLTGVAPFTQPPILSVVPSEELSIPPDLRQRPGLPWPISELFERCLSVDPSRRPSARQIASLLSSQREAG